MVVVVVVAPQLRLVHLRLPHLGMVLAVMRRLMQPVFYACASGFVGRDVR